MGAVCGTDLYKQIRQNHNEEFEKLVVSVQIQKLFNHRFGEMKEQFKREVNNKRVNDLSAVAQEEQDLQMYFDDLQKNVNKHYLGGIKNLEQGTTKKITDILSYNQAKNRLADFKLSLKQTYKRLEEKVEKNFEELKNNQHQKMRNERPQIPMLQKQPIQKQTQIIMEGVKDFKQKIQLREKKYFFGLSDKLNAQRYLKQFNDLLQVQKLKKLKESIRQELNEHAKLLTGDKHDLKAVLF